MLLACLQDLCQRRSVAGWHASCLPVWGQMQMRIVIITAGRPLFKAIHPFWVPSIHRPGGPQPRASFLQNPCVKGRPLKFFTKSFAGAQVLLLYNTVRPACLFFKHPTQKVILSDVFVLGRRGLFHFLQIFSLLISHVKNLKEQNRPLLPRTNFTL